MSHVALLLSLSTAYPETKKSPVKLWVIQSAEAGGDDNHKENQTD